ncbi:glutamine amidotransferase [Collinsella sp. AGMB00827]|uniref:Glutamine amidotransferase n=1 Tax=Collinsella ureilytica TaxID=2869515 RepID=A0ABS7MI08_9ACTN|nr:glutamine amidotransferase [Collinsella urealyticum]MBY4796922.1 glutamine amidotransferase [Collinsella urealyticum]
MGGQRITIETLYPEFGNQAGDNGNLMYLKACLPDAEIVETAYGSEPAFAQRDDISLILMGNMTERQQVQSLEALMPYRDRLDTLADRGLPMLFTGNAAELLGSMIVTPQGQGHVGLGLFDFITHNNMPTRYTCACSGTFDPGDGADPYTVVGFKIQFTQVVARGKLAPFCTLDQGFGLSEGSVYEGVRKNHLLGTWMLGPILPLNPYLVRSLLDWMDATSVPLAYEEVIQDAYRERVRVFSQPGIVF